MERICREEAVAWSRYYSVIWLEGPRRTTEDLSEEGRCPRRIRVTWFHCCSVAALSTTTWRREGTRRWLLHAINVAIVGDDRPAFFCSHSVQEKGPQCIWNRRLWEHRPHPNLVAKGKVSTTARNRTSVVQPETSDLSDWVVSVSSCRYQTKVKLFLCFIERYAINMNAESRHNSPNSSSHH
jgi:hypothetical protein